MKIYTIQREIDGKFLKGLQTYPADNPKWVWGKSPNFWSTIDGVVGMATKLGCRIVNNDKFRGGDLKTWTESRASEGDIVEIKGNSVKWSYFDYDPRKLAGIKIVVMDVTINSSEKLDPALMIATKEAA